MPYKDALAQAYVQKVGARSPMKAKSALRDLLHSIIGDDDAIHEYVRELSHIRACSKNLSKAPLTTCTSSKCPLTICMCKARRPIRPEPARDASIFERPPMPKRPPPGMSASPRLPRSTMASPLRVPTTTPCSLRPGEGDPEGGPARSSHTSTPLSHSPMGSVGRDDRNPEKKQRTSSRSSPQPLHSHNPQCGDGPPPGLAPCSSSETVSVETRSQREGTGQIARLQLSVHRKWRNSEQVPSGVKAITSQHTSSKSSSCTSTSSKSSTCICRCTSSSCRSNSRRAVSRHSERYTTRWLDRFSVA